VSDEPKTVEISTDPDQFKGLEPLKDTTIAPAVGIAAIALNMALKYHDINTIQDGALYQQYKLEGRNIGSLHLDHVFDTAIRMEKYLLGASERIAKVVIDAIADMPFEEEGAAADPEPPKEDK
jgi:hypothetical protein